MSQRREYRVEGQAEPISHLTDAVQAGELLFVSGIVPVDQQRTLIGDGDVVAQARCVFENMRQVLAAAGSVTLVLMHSGREAGMGGLGFTPHSQGGTHVVERNLTRLTVAVATVFGINTILLFHLL